MRVFNFAIATGTGRCGTQFLSRLLALSSKVTTCHDPNPMSLTFHRYCTWNNLPVDHTPFFNAKRKEIEEDLKKGKLSFHSSAHMALSIEDFYKHFDCKVIVLHRKPTDVVSSYYGKGYYQEEYVYQDFNKAIGFQNIGSQPHHFFGRVVPNNEYFNAWNTLTRIGKLGWMWATINKEIARQVASIRPQDVFITKIEDFDFQRYEQLCAFLGVSPVHQKKFQELIASRPNRLPTSGSYEPASWTETECREFISQVSEMADTLGYSIDFLQHSLSLKHETKS